jgi:SAM-dependent methyltransferase
MCGFANKIQQGALGGLLAQIGTQFDLDRHMNGSGGHDTYASVADLYDFVVPYRERRDIDFFVEAARDAGGPVLEVGCGTGRVLIPSARAGIDIVGLDLSPQMLALCRERLQREAPEVQSRVRLVQADMRDFDLGRLFTLVTLPFRPFQHLITVEEEMVCLENVRRHLAERGRLILDLFNPSLDVLGSTTDGEEVGEEPEFSTPDGRLVVRRHRIVAHDRFNQVNQVELIYGLRYPGELIFVARKTR